jgi:hypothetical protein
MAGDGYNQMAQEIIKWNSAHGMAITKSNGKCTDGE